MRCNTYFGDDQNVCPQDKSALEYVGKEPLIGALIHNRYAVDCVAGKGATGIVYKATRLMMGGFVAVKVLHTYQGADSKSLEKFSREITALERLRHPNIVSFFDSGITDDGQPFLVMDFLEGTALTAFIQKGPIPPSIALHITLEICKALQFAHDQGFVHRDMKPDNIVLDRASGEDIVKLLDFGISYTIFENRMNTMARPTTVAGSPAYMSPEQCRGLPLDHRTDIYSLALVVYEMFTGRKPFKANSNKEFMVKTVNEKVPLMSTVRPDLGIPEPVDLVIARALQKNPNDRHSSINVFASELIKSCEGSGFAFTKGSQQSEDDRLQNPSSRVNERMRGQ
ncbi:MAG: serine/threonine protein kinase [Candidatus Obscuribacter sp.]|nr:serine/threonine protein kinase [Candidatus Obscuribacter sp.]MBK7836478.1 serine/threonine protein kinase [Candidatus Obscuribacter sp.]MBK9205732.1 serine/threonine protein kinase [Candidatus Obscuribacter sp.]MBK9617690.1 serine/threonine protein kinase [Candidatus Obscuribacter sp.]MBL0187413.1 serine/threonine protein kinase [Candidatus Obscuribacter sp.]